MTRGTKPAILCALAALALGGCNIVGTAAFIIEGPPKVQAVAGLEDDRPTVIFVDDRASQIPRRSLRVTIGQEAEEILIRQGIVEQENMIAATSTLRTALSEAPDEPMSIADIGLSVGAEVVVYITIDSWTMSQDGSSFSPVVNTRVKIIDAENRMRLWPAYDGGYRLDVEPLTRAAELPKSRAEAAAAEADLARRVGVALAQMFFEHAKTSVRDL